MIIVDSLLLICTDLTRQQFLVPNGHGLAP